MLDDRCRPDSYRETDVSEPTELKIFKWTNDHPATDIGHRTSRFRRPGAGVPPLPIPNREVKPCSTDGTGVTPGRVGRRHIYSNPAINWLGFLRLKHLIQDPGSKNQDYKPTSHVS